MFAVFSTSKLSPEMLFLTLLIQRINWFTLCFFSHVCLCVLPLYRSVVNLTHLQQRKHPDSPDLNAVERAAGYEHTNLVQSLIPETNTSLTITQIHTRMGEGKKPHYSGLFSVFQTFGAE